MNRLRRTYIGRRLNVKARVLQFAAMAVLAFSPMQYAAAQACSKAVSLPEEKWPSTLLETVLDITKRMNEDTKAQVRATPKEELIRFHHGWGTSIRNYYGLWRGNTKLIVSACGQMCHPDEASMIIIESVWQALQSQ